MTAYDWRISYWSSDVCSSDLIDHLAVLADLALDDHFGPSLGASTARFDDVIDENTNVVQPITNGVISSIERRSNAVGPDQLNLDVTPVADRHGEHRVGGLALVLHLT